MVKGLKLKTRIGLFDWEKQIDQIINIDIEVGTDIKKAAETDDVSYSLDYKALSIKVKDYVDNNTHELIETLIEKLASMILHEFTLIVIDLYVFSSIFNDFH